MTDVIFHSKIDTWLALILVATIIFVLAMPYIYYKTNDTTLFQSIFILILPICFSLILLVPSLINTKYIIHSDYLSIRSGIFFWKIPLEDIDSIENSNSLISAPALSTDRLRIKYKNKSILISPKDKENFKEEIMKRTDISYSVK